MLRLRRRLDVHGIMRVALNGLYLSAHMSVLSRDRD